MAATRLALAALRLPWKDLLKAAPHHSQGRRASWSLGWPIGDEDCSSTPRRCPSTTRRCMIRLDALERAGESQAELTKELAGQIKEVSEALRSMAVRILFALGCSLLALVLAVIALVRTFF